MKRTTANQGKIFCLRNEVHVPMHSFQLIDNLATISAVIINQSSWSSATQKRTLANCKLVRELCRELSRRLIIQSVNQIPRVISLDHRTISMNEMQKIHYAPQNMFKICTIISEPRKPSPLFDPCTWRTRLTSTNE